MGPMGICYRIESNEIESFVSTIKLVTLLVTTGQYMHLILKYWSWFLRIKFGLSLSSSPHGLSIGDDSNSNCSQVEKS